MQSLYTSRPRLPAPLHAVRSGAPSVIKSDKGTRQFLEKFVRLPGIYHLLRTVGISKFKKFATTNGIDWEGRVRGFEAIKDELEAIYEEIADPKVEYPWYYLQPFHGYDTGHLNWKAAYEVENALEALSMRQFGELQGRPEEAKEKLLSNIRQAWQERLPTASSALDMACGVGISTEQCAAAYREAAVTGIDLSPHCLSVAQYKQQQRMEAVQRVKYLHMNAENASEKLTNGSFDVVSLTFTIHECPKEVNQKLAAEAFKLCRPGGLFTVTESDNRSDAFLNDSVLRKSLQQMTEPFMVEYASTDVEKLIRKAGFENVVGKSVSPKYCTWTAFKPQLSKSDTS